LRISKERWIVRPCLERETVPAGLTDPRKGKDNHAPATGKTGRPIFGPALFLPVLPFINVRIGHESDHDPSQTLGNPKFAPVICGDRFEDVEVT